MQTDCFLIGLRFISHYAHDYTVQFEWIPLWDDEAVKKSQPILYNEVHIEGINSPYCIYYNSHKKIYPIVVELAKEQFGSIIQKQISETAMLRYVRWYADNTAFGRMKNHPLNSQIWRLRLAFATFFGDFERFNRIFADIAKTIVSNDVAFYAHTVLRIGIHANAWYKVGKSDDIGIDALKQVIFGTTKDVIINSSKTISKVNPLENWYIWHINETPRLVGVLPEKYRNTVYIGTVIPFHSIDSKIKYGFYINTSSVFYVVKRIPHKDVDIYLKVINDNQTIYYQFKGQRAVKELTITNGVAIKLTVDNPKANGYELRKADFSETNWLHSNFITRQEFEDVWHTH